MSEKTPLIRCPFCTRIPEFVKTGKYSGFVKCKCGIEQGRIYSQYSAAAKAWNRRKEKTE